MGQYHQLMTKNAFVLSKALASWSVSAIRRCFFLIVLFVGGLKIAYGQPCSSRLSGHVHSTVAHENLAGAVVTLNGKSIVTDGNGDFRFDSLCVGTYQLVITHTSYDSVVRAVVITKNIHLDLDLKPLEYMLQEVTVSSTRQTLQAGMRKELSGQELEEAKGGSLGEALSKINGVTLLQTGANISKPIVHGLHSNRILTINNGVRQEGQQWGNEHAPEVDPFIANKLTVIKGVDELRYGSDAIGGVILVEPRPLRQTPGYNAEFNAVYFTNNLQYVVSGIFEQQLRKLPAFTYRLQGTFKKAANTATPGYRLNNTGVEEKNFSLAAGWRKEHFSTELYYSFFNTQIGIFSGSHIGGIADLERAIAAPAPDPTFTGKNTYRIERPSQDVVHHLLKSKTSFDVGNSKFNVLVAAQHNQRKEYDVVRNAAARGAQIDLSISTLSEEINWEHPKMANVSGVIGLVAMQQDNSYSGRYLIPNYNSYTYGGYAIEKWAKGKWDAQAGLRFDYKQIDTRRIQAGTQTLYAYDFDFSTLGASVNVGYKVLPEWKTNVTASLATRAPHVNELLVDGIHHGSGTYEKGSLDLQPERSFNLSLVNSYTSKNKLLQLDLTLYRNSIQNYIYQQPKPDAPVQTIRGAFPLVEYNSTDALLQGMDFTSTLNLNPITHTLRLSVLRAENKRIDDWLIWMPSDRISNELAYKFKNGNRFSDTYFSLEVQNVMRQTRVPGDKNGRQDYKAPPPAYTLLNADFSTSFQVSKLPVTVGISGRNLLNKAYREYLNTMRYYADERGRNISLRLKIDLQHLY
jgi:iron complex outermembrane recepter protein